MLKAGEPETTVVAVPPASGSDLISCALVAKNTRVASSASTNPSPSADVASVSGAAPQVPMVQPLSPQSCPQAPQFFASQSGWDSQPFAGSPSQSSKPAAHGMHRWATPHCHPAMMQSPLPSQPQVPLGMH